MIGRRSFAAITSLFALNLIAGCALPIRARGKSDTQLGVPSSWRGRLALRVEADTTTQTPSQSFSAGFELTGNSQAGELLFFTPIGSTAAALHWTPTNALLQTPGETREFADLSQLLDSLLGTTLPVEALFGWLAGQAAEAPGWQADLSQQGQGKILARRLSPTPAAELRVLLED